MAQVVNVRSLSNCPPHSISQPDISLSCPWLSTFPGHERVRRTVQPFPICFRITGACTIFIFQTNPNGLLFKLGFSGKKKRFFSCCYILFSWFTVYYMIPTLTSTFHVSPNEVSHHLKFDSTLFTIIPIKLWALHSMQ